jgi:Methyltransferase domain
MAAEYTLPSADPAVDGEPSSTPAKPIPKRWTPPFQWKHAPDLGAVPDAPRGRARAAVVHRARHRVRDLRHVPGSDAGTAGLGQPRHPRPRSVVDSDRAAGVFGGRPEHRITLTDGPIGETLDAAASRIAPIDYALIDAEHTEKATVENFDRLRPNLAEGAVVVVDDIFMSDEMRRVWQAIQARPGVDLVHTLRRVGIVVARQ